MMKSQFPLLTLLLIGLVLFGASFIKKEKSTPGRQRINFDLNWKFYQGDKAGAENPNFPVDDWRSVNLPHDWSIEGKYDTIYGTDWQSGYLPAGIGWYRKTFDWHSEWQNKKVSVQFDGVYMNSDVWLNGQHLGKRPYGYISFMYDLTPYLKKGKNILAVKVDHSKPQSGRWYTGSGIYRHVWLEVTNPVRVAHWGTQVTTPGVSAAKATINIKTQVLSEGITGENIQLETRILDKTGKTVASGTTAKKSDEAKTLDFEQQLTIEGPQLWSPDTPYLYEVVNIVRVRNQVTDEYHTPLGIRKLDFNAAKGFLLNDKQVKIKGVCLHHDAGPVGAAVPDDVLYRRLKLLKDMGCNTIRTSHNPFAPEFYSMCDSLGIMVMNETFDGWETAKARHDYGNYFAEWWQKDATDFIRRDRNHPSIIIWSIGNEVVKGTLDTQKKLLQLFHTLDPTRPVTQGGHDPTRGMTGDKARTALDINGFNGGGEEIGAFEEFHEKFPDIPSIGTEVPHTYQTRGVYRTTTNWRRQHFPAPWEIRSGSAGSMKDKADKVFRIADLAPQEVFPEEQQTTYYQNGEVKPILNKKPWATNIYYQSSYDNATVRSSARKAWQRVRDFDYVMGHFRWTGFDYLGETNGWPSRMANFGVLDICGFPKDHYYLYQSLWTEKPMVHLLPHWTHPAKEGTKIPVVVYTNGDAVELFLNGKSLGKQPYQDEQLVWQVPYEPGTIKAVALKNGKEVATHSYTTAGAPAAIQVKLDKNQLNANLKDITHLEVTVVDSKGTPVPLATNNISFSVNGPGKLIGVDNGDPLDLSNYKTNQRRAFRGKCLGLVQATDKPGVIKVNLSSPGLKSKEVTIQVKKDESEKRIGL
ncbi:beta-galactosidase [Adhaeribacter aerolatus]|uniref:Beta-galactosidase n=1 Tax=Adhaeribacter aerolatus TaxID=670289 RepID=A0A512B675_9BACT|nr:sugar-binding domain-containing protein [Adhaeribacter aerolatus]GEO07461.1 beta-galactosidase [Adhaeribacter aerolatus]